MRKFLSLCTFIFLLFSCSPNMPEQKSDSFVNVPSFIELGNITTSKTIGINQDNMLDIYYFSKSPALSGFKKQEVPNGGIYSTSLFNRNIDIKVEEKENSVIRYLGFAENERDIFFDLTYDEKTNTFSYLQVFEGSIERGATTSILHVVVGKNIKNEKGRIQGAFRAYDVKCEEDFYYMTVTDSEFFANDIISGIAIRVLYNAGSDSSVEINEEMKNLKLTLCNNEGIDIANINQVIAVGNRISEVEAEEEYYSLIYFDKEMKSIEKFALNDILYLIPEESTPEKVKSEALRISKGEWEVLF